MINKKWLTMIEAIIAVTIISTWIMGVYSIVNYAIKFVDATKVKVTGINIAREGIEWVFNLRDTNWKRWWGNKDQCWLKADPLVDEWSDWCANDTWFKTWSYILVNKTIQNWFEPQQYYLLTGRSNNKLNALPWTSIDAWVDPSDLEYIMCLNDKYMESCPWTSELNTNTASDFFREIRWWDLIEKSNNQDISSCSSWTDGTCWSNSFKEKQFCSIVQYIWLTYWEVKLCAVMTNFVE